MIRLAKGQLPELLGILEKDFPKSLMVYFMAKNVIDGKYSWPGITFLVDDFPEVSVCICRPTSAESSVPTLRKSTIFTTSNDPEIFAKCLKEKETIDWSQNALFPAITSAEEHILITHCKENDLGEAAWFNVFLGLKPDPAADIVAPYAVFYHFDLSQIHHEYNLPEGLRLGTLLPKHAPKIARDKKYGDLKNNEEYLQYMLDHNFLNVCVYNKEDEPVTYAIQSPQGCVGTGYTHPNYRSRGLFKIVCYELMKKMKDDGQSFTYVDIMAENSYSRRAVESLGAKLYENFTCAWIEFKPKTKVLS